MEKLQTSIEVNNSLVCVGLDINPEQMPKDLFSEADPYLQFNKAIIDSTKDLVCAYKLNMAFYEALGERCFSLLQNTIKAIPRGIVIILDGKRNDIGNTAKKYASACFDILGADAVTITPYLGKDGIQPFTNYKNKGVFILCRTSNPSASELQNFPSNQHPLYQHVAALLQQWNEQGNCGLVAGATYPKELAHIRSVVGDQIPLLIPGVGKQGGDLEQAVKNGVNSTSTNAIINSSRGIIYADTSSSFAEGARAATEHLREEINSYR